MTGFSADWLALREPMDAVSRNLELTAALVAWRARHDALSVLDLGAGTGANFRFLAPRLGGHQHWRLIDHDPALLAQIGRIHQEWAAARTLNVSVEGAGWVIQGGDDAWHLEIRRLDLAGDWEPLDFRGAQLVTAAALLDLVSAHWLERLAPRCREQGAAVFVTLSYDGGIAWDPVEDGDEAVRRLLNRHQQTDKGFGPALGPAAADRFAAVLAGLDYTVTRRPSLWSLGPPHAALQTAVLDGWAAAARAVAPGMAQDLRDWTRRRRDWIERGESRLTVGHQDLFAVPVDESASAFKPPLPWDRAPAESPPPAAGPGRDTAPAPPVR